MLEWILYDPNLMNFVTFIVILMRLCTFALTKYQSFAILPFVLLNPFLGTNNVVPFGTFIHHSMKWKGDYHLALKYQYID